MFKRLLFGGLFLVLINPLANAQQSTQPTLMDKITPKNQSVLEKRLKKMQETERNPFSISLYRPTYVLPFYYTGSPDYAVYQGNTPNGQNIMHSELKAQLSLQVPVITHLINNKTSLNIGYTQLSYWQIYASSQYFRETDYEPEIFIASHFHENWLMQASLDHQSNGRGGSLERSWNRAILGAVVSGEKWVFGLKTWALIFKAESSDLHNPDITYYLGHDVALFSYTLGKSVTTLQIQNLESCLKRGSVQVTVSYPITKHFLLYTQYFNGYGQSLIEYNHKTHSAGIGIAFNDWI